ncbi:MAG TPA: Asp-tRNA(Asn)/Glu-tRNA(Gln) amidotransferase subunit GatB [Candidatus Paceibacterota bacterium]|nr:Asp-tRNA(Asn)/Glu-tRNA(Gln) amidotransferase subunit GatB [Candidatus Paceibacterota bacterium]
MTDEYETTIGLEVHAELKTKTKMFCSSKNDPDETRPNMNICPVCLAHPGTLPVPNCEALELVLKVGASLGSTLADYTEFDRKNYFYPDLPKGYQISQFEFPLVAGGSLNGVEITRIHLEEDTASSIHDDNTGTTLIDYNRSGVPLMELVTEPVMHSAQEAGDFARELQVLLRTLGVSEANMEKGQMRVEANVSVAKKGTRSAAYVEIKNLNSFRAMERAVAYEIKRQQGMLDRGEILTKQTLGWDEAKQETFPQRSKEGSADYRYFPDPDIPSLRLSEIPYYKPSRIQSSLPELPNQKRVRYESLGINPEDAQMYVNQKILGSFFEEVIANETDSTKIKLASNYIANDLVKIIRDSSSRDTESKEIIEISVPISADYFRSIIDLIASNKISSRSGKDLLRLTIEENRQPEELAKERGLMMQNSAFDLDALIAKIVADNPKVVGEYKSGKDSVLEFLVGQGMKALRGSGDPQALRKAFLSNLKH